MSQITTEINLIQSDFSKCEKLSEVIQNAIKRGEGGGVYDTTKYLYIGIFPNDESLTIKLEDNFIFDSKAQIKCDIEGKDVSINNFVSSYDSNIKLRGYNNIIENGTLQFINTITYDLTIDNDLKIKNEGYLYINSNSFVNGLKYGHIYVQDGGTLDIQNSHIDIIDIVDGNSSSSYIVYLYINGGTVNISNQGILNIKNLIDVKNGTINVKKNGTLNVYKELNIENGNINVENEGKLNIVNDGLIKIKKSKLDLINNLLDQNYDVITSEYKNSLISQINDLNNEIQNTKTNIYNSVLSSFNVSNPSVESFEDYNDILFKQFEVLLDSKLSDINKSDTIWPAQAISGQISKLKEEIKQLENNQPDDKDEDNEDIDLNNLKEKINLLENNLSSIDTKIQKLILLSLINVKNI